MLKRIDYILNNEDGASMTEIVVWISVILIIVTLFILFHDAIVEFLKRGVNNLDRKHTGHSYISGE